MHPVFISFYRPSDIVSIIGCNSKKLKNFLRINEIVYNSSRLNDEREIRKWLLKLRIYELKISYIYVQTIFQFNIDN